MSSFETLSARDPDLVKLRYGVRDFLRSDRAEFGWQPTVDSWLGEWDEEFSARLGAAGFVGLTIPCRYGGHQLGHLHRYVVAEELIAAAHAGCFAMQLSAMLTENGTPPDLLNVSAVVEVIPGTGITGSALTLEAKVPGIDQAKLADIADKAKSTCPVSKALGAIDVTLEARLV